MRKSIITVMLILSMNIEAQTEVEDLTMSLTGYRYDYIVSENGSLVTTIYSGTYFFRSDGVYGEQGQKVEKYSFDDLYYQYSYSGKWWIDLDKNCNPELNRFFYETKKTTSVKFAIRIGFLYLDDSQITDVYLVNCY